MTVAEKLTEQTGVIEKLDISAFERIEAPYVGSYIHGGKIATIVTHLNNAVDKADELTKDLAMQVASMEQLLCLLKILTQHLYF